MNESRDFRVALLSGSSTGWRDTVTTLLLAQTDYLVLPDTADELLSLPPASHAAWKSRMTVSSRDPAKASSISS